MDYLRVSGIYDHQTIGFLKQKGIQKFTFDLRPISFNFVQAFKICELINESYQYGDDYAFQFDLDKDFVIKNVIERIESKASVSLSSLAIEFCSSRTLNECEQFSRPFIWHYDEHYEKDFFQSKFLHTVIFKQGLIHQLDLSQKLYPFMDKFFKHCPNHVNVELEMDWNSPILSTLIDFFPINGLNYAINSRVEKSFRHVDLQLVGQHIEHTISHLNI